MDYQTFRLDPNALQPADISLGGQALRVLTKPGIPGWNTPTPSAVLLAENTEIPPDGQVLLSGGGPGALAVWLARGLPEGRLMVSDHNYLALALTERNLALNNLDNASVLYAASLPEQVYGQCDVVVMDLPKGRKLTRRRLLEAQQALKPGGMLYLAGANDLGVQPALKDAEEIFGAATILAYKKGNRVARFAKAGLAKAGFAMAGLPSPDEPDLIPEWAVEPGVAPGTWHEFDLDIQGKPYHLYSLPGVFSYDSLDEGTALLLEHLPVIPGGRALDVGCGYGIIGMHLARAGMGQVDLVDLDLLAVASARENIRVNAVSNATAFPSDGIPLESGGYDLIASNPPFHTGRDVDFQVTQTFIARASQSLNQDGKLVLVANRFIRYEPVLDQYFRRVRVLAQTEKFKVLQAEARKKMKGKQREESSS